MKRVMSIALASAFLFGVLGMSSVYADGGHGKDGKKCEMMKKIQMMFYNKKELGLDDKQIEKLKDIKHDSMKEKIKATADMDILKVDMKSLMHADTLDADKLKSLVSKKYDIKKDLMIKSIDAYAKALNVLTPEQKKIYKDLCHESWKAKIGHWFGCKKCGGHGEKGGRYKK